MRTVFIGLILLGLTLNCSRRNDVTVPGDIYVFVSQIQTSGFKRDLKVVDSLVFVADDENGITVLDVSDKTMPKVVSIKVTTRYPFGVDAFPAQQILITAEGSGDVGIYSYQRPDSLFIESTVYAQSAQNVVAHTQNDSLYIWVADRDRDFLGYRLEMTIDPWGTRIWTAYEISEIHYMLGRGMDVFHHNNYIYIAGGQWGLHILDAHNISEITRVGGIDTNGYSQSLWVEGNLAYIADAEKGLKIIDVADPVNPVLLSSIDTRDATVQVTAKDNRVFLATSQSGLYIIDTTDPAAPAIIQRYDTPNARAVEVVDNYVYLLDKYDGLIILKDSTHN